MSDASVFLVYCKGVDGMLKIHSEAEQHRKWTRQLLYFELLSRGVESDEMCCLFVYAETDPATLLRESIRHWLLTKIKFEKIREIGGLTLMNGLRHIRIMYKTWESSLLRVPLHATSDMRDLDKMQNDVTFRLVMWALDAMNALHCSQLTVVPTAEPSALVRKYGLHLFSMHGQILISHPLKDSAGIPSIGSGTKQARRLSCTQSMLSSPSSSYESSEGIMAPQNLQCILLGGRPIRRQSIAYIPLKIEYDENHDDPDYSPLRRKTISSSVMYLDLTDFAKNASVDINDTSLVFCLRIVSSFSHIKQKDVLMDVLWNLEQREESRKFIRPSVDEIDWKTLTAFLNNDGLANANVVCKFWLKFLSFIEFVDEPTLKEEMQQYLLKLSKNMSVSVPQYCSPIDAIRIASFKAISRCKVVSNCEPSSIVSWDLVCKIFLLMNVIQEDSSMAIFGLLQPTIGNIENIGVQIAGHFVSFKNNVAEFQDTLVTLLTTYMKVNERELQLAVAAAAKETSKIESMAKAIFLQRQRPSMTELAQAHGRQSQMRFARGEREDFSTFSQMCRFPLTMDTLVQQYVYLLKCMHNAPGVGDLWPYVRSIVVCPILLKNIESVTIVAIDVKPIVALIVASKHVGDACVSIKKFRASCIDPFLNNQQSKLQMNWSVVLQLYLAAFQAKSIRLVCWRNVVECMRTKSFDQACTGETLQAVDTFVSSEVFDAENALGMLRRGIRAFG